MANGEWRGWPVAWSALWIGALAAIAAGLVIGLIGFAIGAHEVSRTVDWRKARLISLVFSVGGAFFAFVIGGWVAARLADLRRSEPAMIHGAMTWLVALPLLLVLAALGVTMHFGGWYGGLAGMPAWATAIPPADPRLAEGTRNTALATVAALLLGLVGSVIGGWMASGEAMTLARRRRYEADYDERPRRVA